MGETEHSSSGTPSHNANRPIFLIGYRGCGKSSVAKLLAQKLGYVCIDADVLLEERQGHTIREIFAEVEGENRFREIEGKMLAEFCRCERHVIATGGGVVLRAENRKSLTQSGTVVWLTADPAILFQRMQDDPTTPERRPNLTTGGLREVEEVLGERHHLYAKCAHFTVDTTGRNPEDVASIVFEELLKAGRIATEQCP